MTPGKTTADSLRAFLAERGHADLADKLIEARNNGRLAPTIRRQGLADLHWDIAARMPGPEVGQRIVLRAGEVWVRQGPLRSDLLMVVSAVTWTPSHSNPGWSVTGEAFSPDGAGTFRLRRGVKTYYVTAYPGDAWMPALNH